MNGAARRSLLLALALAAGPVLADPALRSAIKAQEIAATSHPERARTALETLAPRVEGGSFEDRRTYFSALGYAQALSGDEKGALASAAELQSMGEKARDAEARAQAELIRAHVGFAAGRLEPARQAQRKAQALIDARSPLSLRYWSASLGATMLHQAGDFEEALAQYQTALRLAEEMGDARRQVHMLNNIANLHLSLKHADESVRMLGDAYLLAAQLRDRETMAALKLSEAAALGELERTEAQHAALQESLKLARMAGSPAMEVAALTNLSDFHLQRGEYAAVQQVVARARALGAAPDWDTEATLSVNAGLAHILAGDIARGRSEVEAVLKRYEEQGLPAEAAATLREYGDALRRTGQTTLALDALLRERTLNEALFRSERQRAVVELQARYALEKQRKEIALLERANALKAAELANRSRERWIGALVAVVLALGAVIVGLLYRRQREANRSLAADNAALARESHRDPLTGLYNRRFFRQRMQAEPPERGMQALLLIDIDHFKRINDRLGHAAGDAVLIEVATRLNTALAEHCVVRWGGEEFLVHARIATPEEAGAIARVAMAAISGNTVQTGERPIAVTASIGYAVSPLAGGDAHLPWSQRINLIDTALYLAKAHGRSRCYGLRRMDAEDAAAVRRIEQDLELAWEEGRVDLEVSVGPPAMPVS